jgi:hypothetical protein
MGGGTAKEHDQGKRRESFAGVTAKEEHDKAIKAQVQGLVGEFGGSLCGT